MSGASVVVVSSDELRALIRAAVDDALAARASAANEAPAEWLDARGAAAVLAVHPRTVAKLAKSGELPASRVGKLLRFRRADVAAFLERQRTG